MHTIYWPKYAIDKKEQVVIYDNIRMADVIFLPDSCVSGFDLSGYELWKGGHVTAKGKLLLIYAKEKLIVR